MLATVRTILIALLVTGGFAYALITAPAAFGWAQAASDEVVGTGDLTTQQRSLGSFHGVRVKGSTDVTITVGGVQSVAVEAQPNILPLIETTVSDGTLVVSTHMSFTTKEKSVVHVAVPSLDAVGVNGSGDAEISGVNGASLDLEVNGSGDFKVSGSTGRLTYTSRGSGDADLGNLQVRDAVVKIYGSGDAKLAVSDSLDVQVNGSGDVTYSGHPRVTQEIRGSGSVSER